MCRLIHILTLFAILFVFQTDKCFACGGTSNEITNESNPSSQNESCCKPHPDGVSKDGKNCGGNCDGHCGDSSCQCARSISVPFLNEVAFRLVHHFNTIKQGWVFDKNLPNPVYLAIWALPKIG